MQRRRGKSAWHRPFFLLPPLFSLLLFMQTSCVQQLRSPGLIALAYGRGVAVTQLFVSEEGGGGGRYASLDSFHKEHWLRNQHVGASGHLM